MKNSNDGSDRIVILLVAVLGLIVLGVIATLVIQALDPNQQSEIGAQVSTFLATIGGGIVGIAGAYVTNSPWTSAVTAQQPDESLTYIASEPTDESDDVEPTDSADGTKRERRHP